MKYLSIIFLLSNLFFTATLVAMNTDKDRKTCAAHLEQAAAHASKNEGLTPAQQAVASFWNLPDVLVDIVQEYRGPAEPILLRTLNGHESYILSLATLSDGHLASGALDKMIKIWDTVAGTCIRTLAGHSNSITSLAVLTNGHLASGSEDRTIKIWNYKTGTLLKTLSGHTDAIELMIALPNGNVASGSKDGSIKIWHPDGGHCITSLENAFSLGDQLIALPRGHIGLINKYGTTVSIHSPLSCQYLHAVPNYYIGKPIRFVSTQTILANGAVASRLLSSEVTLWDPSTGHLFAQLKTDNFLFNTLTPLPNGKHVAGDQFGYLVFFDGITNKSRPERGHEAWVRALAVLSTGVLASGGGDVIKLWDPGYTLRDLAQHMRSGKPCDELATQKPTYKHVLFDYAQGREAIVHPETGLISHYVVPPQQILQAAWAELATIENAVKH